MNKTTFHLICSFDFANLDGKDGDLTYRFTRKVYDEFILAHRERLQNAIAKLSNPRLKLFTSNVTLENESELANSQEIAASAHLSQGAAGLKKPRLPLMVMLQKKNDLQKE